MHAEEYSLDDHALEIILLAAGFFGLIVAFLLVILSTTKLRRFSDAELGERKFMLARSKWNSAASDMKTSTKPFQDVSPASTSRRSSASFVEEVRTQLRRITGISTLSMLSGETTPVEGVPLLAPFSYSRRPSNTTHQGDSSEELIEDQSSGSPLPATWNQCAGESRRRSGRLLDRLTDADEG